MACIGSAINNYFILLVSEFYNWNIHSYLLCFFYAPMADDKQANLKELLNARFQNPKFVYDGKRIQPIYERQTYDYSSALIFEQYASILPVYKYPNFNLGSQILNMPAPSSCSPYDAVTNRFVHMSMNKIRSPINSIIWNSDGRRLLSGSCSGEITLWNGFSFNFDTIVQAHESPIRAMTWSPSSSFLITSDNLGIIKYWNSSMSNIQVIQAHNEGIKDLSFSFNDTRFCSASDDATIKVWDSITAKCERVLTGHNWDVRKAQWHDTKALIASGGKDNLLKMWDPRQEECLTTFHHHKNTILSLKFYKDNYLLSGGKDQVIKMIDLRMMKECFTYKNHNKDVTALAVHPFNNLFVSGNNEGLISFWDLFNESPIAVSDNKHDNTIWSLDFHPAGHVLASGAADYTVRFWLRPRPKHYELFDTALHEMEATYQSSEIPGL